MEGGSDGSFMHIDVAPAVKLVIFSCVGSVLFALFVLVGFGNSPAVAVFESTSNETRCTSAFTLEQFDECSGESLTNSAGFGSLAAVDELLRLNESQQTMVLSCMLDQCDITTNMSSTIAKEEELLVAEFSFELNNLSPRNRYFYVEILFPNDEPDADHSFAVTITADMKGIYENETTGGNSTVEISPSVRQETVNITCVQGESHCEPHFMLRFNNIDYEDYQVGLLLNSTEYLPINGSSVTFRLAAGSAKFTNWMLGMKIFFLLVSTAVAVKYNLSLNALSIREQNLEQTWVSILSVTLVFYNDPFFVVEASYGGNALKILGVAFQVTFFQFLLLFWLLALDNMRLSGMESGVSNERFFIPKAFFIGWFWVFNCVYFGYMKYNSNNDTLWDPLENNNTFALAQSLMVVICLVYVMWFVYLLFACLPELRTKPTRYRYLMFVMCYVFLIWLSAIGSTAISPVPLSGGSWTACLALFNIYIYALAYLYAPSAKTIAQAKQRQAMHGDRAEPEARPVLQPTATYVEAVDGDHVDIEDVNLA